MSCDSRSDVPAVVDRFISGKRASACGVRRHSTVTARSQLWIIGYSGHRVSNGTRRCANGMASQTRRSNSARSGARRPARRRSKTTQHGFCRSSHSSDSQFNKCSAGGNVACATDTRRSQLIWILSCLGRARRKKARMEKLIESKASPEPRLDRGEIVGRLLAHSEKLDESTNELREVMEELRGRQGA